MPSGDFILARSAPAPLRVALERHLGAFKEKWIPWTRAPYALGEYRGCAYLSDDQGSLAQEIDPDIFVEVSRDLGGLVVAFSFETVSVSSFFLAVNKGSLVRLWSSSTGLREPLDRGTPLPSESVVPLDRVEGLMAAVVGLGFQVAEWTRAGSKLALRPREGISEARPKVDSPLGLGLLLREHRRAHEIPHDEWLRVFEPQVVETHPSGPAASFALTSGAGAFRIEMRRRGESAKERKAPAALAAFDRKLLFPQIVPQGYLTDEPGAVRLPLVEGLDVALVIHHATSSASGAGANEPAFGVGFALYVDARELEGERLAPREAFAIALENLLAEVKAGRLQTLAVSDEPGPPKAIVFSGHWLAAACVLLPGLAERMKEALGGHELIAMLPHRDFLAIVPRGDAATVEKIREGEKAGRKRITERIFRLLPDVTAPFFECAPIAAIED